MSKLISFFFGSPSVTVTYGPRKIGAHHRSAWFLATVEKYSLDR